MPNILYLVTEDWFFSSHFLPMARAAQGIGLNVAVVTRVHRHGDKISAAGIRVIPYDSRRGSVGLIAGLRELFQVFSIMRRERPDIVHCVALRPALFGGLIARLFGIKAVVLAPTGLGHLWVENRFSVRALRSAVRFVLGKVLRRPGTHYVFENRDDPIEFGLDPDARNVTIVGGAGVNPDAYPPSPEPAAPPVKFAVVSRMIWHKGIADAVEAVRLARERGAPVELHLFGSPDSSSRNSISEDDLRRWSSLPGIHWHGHAEDVARVWREHHAALFLTYYREGVPRALIEAAACGRPIVTTDMPGCRDLVRDGQEGILVPPRDIEAAAAAVARLARDASMRSRLGAAAHARFRASFTESAVTSAISEVYGTLLRQP